MKRSIIREMASRGDLREIALYIGRKSPQSAARFLASAERTFAQLAAQPGIGVRYAPDNREYADLRLCPVTRFRSYLIVYRATDDRLDVIRVLHAARDIDQILADALDPPDGPA